MQITSRVSCGVLGFMPKKGHTCQRGNVTTVPLNDSWVGETGRRQGWPGGTHWSLDE